MSCASPRRREPLERLLSKWRVATRTQAQRLAREGRVRVGGARVLDPRALVDPARDVVEVDGRRVRPAQDAGVWLAVNKPRGVVSTTHDPSGRPTVMDLVQGPLPAGLAPVGRLDKASAGLLLLTNDHGLADRLLDPRTHVSKRYRVKVKPRLSDADLSRLRSETLVEDGLVLAPMDVRVESEGPRSTWIVVALDEGKNRQIRRRVEDLGHEVETLVRVAVGPIALGDLAPGAVRALEPAEVAGLRAATVRSRRGEGEAHSGGVPP